MKQDRSLLMRIWAVIAILFGLLTITSGARVLFGSAAEKLAAGNVVDFILWCNFLLGFVYVIAGIGLWRRAAWAVKLAAIIATTTLLMFISLGVYIAGGGSYENRTLSAMVLRSVFWFTLYLVARKRVLA